MFVKFFMMEKHYKYKKGTPKIKKTSEVISKVFESLYRDDLGVSKSYIDIGFVADYLKDKFPLNTGNDAKQIITTLFKMLIVEHTPLDLTKRLLNEKMKTNKDMITFRNISHINQFFSVMLKKKYKCPKGHHFYLLNQSMGLELDGP